MLDTAYETHGYDGRRGRLWWWFEAWGEGGKDEWTTREQAGRAPTPAELRDADYIVFGFRKNNGLGRPFYRTRVGGLDFRKQKKRRKR